MGINMWKKKDLKEKSKKYKSIVDEYQCGYDHGFLSYLYIEKINIIFAVMGIGSIPTLLINKTYQIKWVFGQKSFGQMSCS